MGYVEHFYNIDPDVAEDALLLATASGIAVQSPLLDFEVYNLSVSTSHHLKSSITHIALHAARRVLASDACHGDDEPFLRGYLDGHLSTSLSTAQNSAPRPHSSFFAYTRAGKHFDIRRSALGIASSARQDLITAAGVDEPLRDMVFSKLSPALLTVAENNLDNYHILIFALAKSPDWCRRLIRDGHVVKCITVIHTLHYRIKALPFYLAGFSSALLP
ncbi:hypothetical protein AZE42_07748 [Rhizopogon vesiculosus]|uniref:Uncharacterized protein n=1 Tax=Rhizopogon vesiculosus TaxID=180088 RepID=A0A1J8Q961_9AGAM|nr:hypothetical protein AZE42_07748 [Rhizopogon vesiculosus]